MTLPRIHTATATPAPPAAQAPTQIGITADGQPIYAWAQTPPPVVPQPIAAHPWGAYIAGGCLAVVAVAIVGAVALAIIIGLSIALLVVALAATALTTCLLILRSVWNGTRQR